MTGNLLAALAVVVSIAAFIVSVLSRRSDIAREEAYRVRSRIWEILDREPGLRTVLTLKEPIDDPGVAKRVDLLGRTAKQLEIAGAPALARQLSAVLDQPWGRNTTEESLRSLDNFLEAARETVRPAGATHDGTKA